jgi:hypothetical protein
MSITYTYEIVAVDEAARVMEVVYTAEGHPTQHIGARLPYEGESLEAVVDMYAPVRFWEELQSAVVVPSVGVTGTVEPPAPFVSEEPSAETEARAYRKQLLSITDWTQLPDSPLSAEKKAEWATYRQALRDITEQAGFPDNIQWPVQPE